MKPTIGRIVIYNTTGLERSEMEQNPQCNVSEKLPAMITAVWSDDCVNLKVFLDGEGEIWKTSAQKGDDEDQWNWPVIQK